MLSWLSVMAVAWSPASPLPVTIRTLRAESSAVMAAPSPPPAVDLRANAKPPVQDKYGRDPRDSSEAVAGDAAWAATLSAGQINSLENIEQLQGALDAASAGQELVVIKFMRDGCAACASTQKQYQAAAKSYASRAKFFEVDYDLSKPFCKACKLRFVPSAHLYRGTEFIAAMPLGKSAWDAFASRLKEEAP